MADRLEDDLAAAVGEVTDGGDALLAALGEARGDDEQGAHAGLGAVVDDVEHALGVAVGRTRIAVVFAAVGMIACATAVAGPIAFISFLSGPIAARIVGGGGSLLVPAALVGALLALGGDYVGQFLLPSRYPVGVVTGALGAPYLLYLIMRINRGGRSL